MIIAVIPAQSKSTRLPGKNMRKMLGKPLIDYTIDYAKNCHLIDEIYVSTDSDEIAGHSASRGVKAVIRPEGLCGNVAIVDVLKHCLDNIPQKDSITRVVALQVDHPDRTLDLTEFLKGVIDRDIADAITIEPDGIRNGSIRILRKKDLMEDKISYSIMALRDDCTNIHFKEDFDRAEERIKRRTSV